MNQPNLDPVAVLILFATAVFSPAVAAVVGPYLVILLGSTLGAYFRLGQRPSSTRAEGLRFFLAANCAAILFTVPLAVVANKYLPGVEVNWLLGPMAFGIGLIGDRWPQIGQWIARKVAMLVDVLIRARASDHKTGDGNGS
ncbi:hypothetical protein [Variovorax sp. EBFNA2]|uniref:hypothetical protein n=1 Tax=Variovorax sp. EBFNA2 TaxID=3342097 RepID=UPI0029C0C7D1|nr:hypothetical protein [Variovorax boronicumulans]WPG35124.1 hypothetical protein RZE79_16665 [Variovorax boronicumulans]